MPFAKSGILSAMSNGETSRLYLDAHGNQGFSGGPVVYLPDDVRGNEYRLAGIVSESPTPLARPVIDKDGNPIVDAQKNPVAYFNESQGFVVAIDIRHAIDLIDANPVGFRLSDSE